jgi:hypothetical protein
MKDMSVPAGLANVVCCCPFSHLCLVLVLRILSSEGHLGQLRSSFLFVEGETLGGIYVVREIYCAEIFEAVRS